MRFLGPMLLIVAACDCGASHTRDDGGAAVTRLDATRAADAGREMDGGAAPDAGPPSLDASTLTCDELREAIVHELAAVRSCTSDDQCGRVVPLSSCGCTRDLVARVDADLSRLEALRGEVRPDCYIGLFGSPCDCPAADGFACAGGECSWCYVGMLPSCGDDRSPRCAVPMNQCDCGVPWARVRVRIDADGVVSALEDAGDGPELSESELACLREHADPYCYPRLAGTEIVLAGGSCTD